MLRAPIVIASVVIAALFAALPASATTIAREDGPTTVEAHGGRLVWSHFDLSTRQYFLISRIDGVSARVPISPRKTPFDVDLGPDASGTTVAVYSRCVVDGRQGARWVGGTATPRGCDVYLYDFAKGSERKVPLASKQNCSEFNPSIWRDTVAFARSCGRDRQGVWTASHDLEDAEDTEYVGLYPLEKLGKPQGYGISAVELRGRDVAYVTNEIGKRSGKFRFASTIRLHHGSKRRVAMFTSFGESVAYLLSPSLDDRYLYFGHYGSDLRRNFAARYQLKNGRMEMSNLPDTLESVVPDGNTLDYSLGFDGCRQTCELVAGNVPVWRPVRPASVGLYHGFPPVRYR